MHNKVIVQWHASILTISIAVVVREQLMLLLLVGRFFRGCMVPIDIGS